jgi:hypothetical protein
MPTSFGALKGQKALPFLSWLLSFIKKFNYTTKDVIILHLKLGNNG